MKSRFFYQKLVLTNIKKNSKTYIPYIVTCIGIIVMFYNMFALAKNNSTGDGSLSSILMIGTWVIALFSGVFIFYTNSFLVRRRKREFGIYNVLGMEKKHIAKVMFWENLMIASIALVFGLFFGILFSKLVTLILHKILRFDPGYGFDVNGVVVLSTVILFLFIFVLTLLSSLCQVYRSKPVELLSSSSVGEKEPKSNWFFAIIGILSLGAGYAIALTVDNPMATLLLFFLAVIFVIIGTYCLFTAGSIVFLKALRKNKRFYYQTNHFVSLSGMIYRMKKNAMGLANICIMSTAVLVMVSTTISMYVGMNDVLAKRFPNDVMLTTEYTPETSMDGDILQNSICELLQNDNVPYSDFVSYESLQLVAVRDGDTYTASQADITTNIDEISILIVLTVDDFSKFSEEQYQLKENEVIIVSKRNTEKVNIMGHEFSVKKTLDKIPFGESSTWLADVVYVVVNSPLIIDELYYEQEKVYRDNASNIEYLIAFNFAMEDKEIVDYCNNTFVANINNQPFDFRYEIKQLSKQQFYIFYGGLFFLGIFLGFLFLMATVLIIYYKQVVEGYEDRERFRIMQNVGMSTQEIKRAVNSQILLVFALPVFAAVIHIAMAFRILTRLLSMFNLTNIPLFVVCTVVTIIVFALFYTLVYFATSKIYYKIINQEQRNIG